MPTGLPTELTLAVALRDYRERTGLTQAQLARKLRIPERSIQAYEAGAMPQTKRRQKILAFLHRDAERGRAA